MSDERDAQIAALIRVEVAKVEITAKQMGYERGTANDAYMQGQIVGLRTALRFVDPNLYRDRRHGQTHPAGLPHD